MARAHRQRLRVRRLRIIAQEQIDRLATIHHTSRGVDPRANLVDDVGHRNLTDVYKRQGLPELPPVMSLSERKQVKR